MHVRSYLAHRGRCILAIAYLFCGSIGAASADDPLIAFPTLGAPVNARVQLLNDVELQAIHPLDPKQLVFSIALAPAEGNANAPNAGNAKPWITVYGDGRIVCQALVPGALLREATLSNAELTWLLHLACNECQILTRSTQTIEQNIRQYPRRIPEELTNWRVRQYQLNVASGRNQLEIPGEALTIRSLRAYLKFGAFASLDKYVNFLVSRAYLGPPEVQQSLLNQLNQKLSKDHPKLAPFDITDLASAVSTNSIELSALFQRNVEVGDHQFRRVTGLIIRKPGEPTTEIRIQSLDYLHH